MYVVKCFLKTAKMARKCR